MKVQAMKATTNIFIGVMMGMLIMQAIELGNPESVTEVAYLGKPNNSTDTISEWDIFVEALIWVESGGRADAVGKTNDLGILQITPIYVADANRILGEDRYSHKDALCPQKSLEMFEVVQSHYNPTKCLKRAISKHNPRAGDWYAERIYNRMNEIKLNNI